MQWQCDTSFASHSSKVGCNEVRILHSCQQHLTPINARFIAEVTDANKKRKRISVSEVCAFVIAGSPVIVNGDEFENIEMRRVSDLFPTSSGRVDNRPQNGHTAAGGGVQSPDGNDNSQLRDMIEINRNLQNLVIGAQTIDVEKRDYSSGYASESGDMLRELVKNKELMRIGRKKELTRFSSVDSDVSEGSTLVSTASDVDANGERRKRPRINHHAIRSTVSEPDVEQLALVVRIHTQLIEQLV